MESITKNILIQVILLMKIKMEILLKVLVILLIHLV